jgi:hypothetical protein
MKGLNNLVEADHFPTKVILTGAELLVRVVELAAQRRKCERLT